jgi:sugar phosphate isomerase/epimerase
VKLSISNLAWDRAEDQAAISAVVRAGGSAIDVAPTKLWSDLEGTAGGDVQAYASQCRSLGVRIVGLQSLLYGRPELALFGEPGQRTQALSYLERVMALGFGLGASHFLLGAPQNRRQHSKSPETCLDLAVSLCRRLAEAAAKAGAVFCFEPLAPAYGCEFVCTTAEAVELAGLVNHPAFGILLDTGVLAMNDERLEDAVTLAGPHLRYVQLAEPHLQPVDLARKTDEIQRLRRLGYSGWISVEMLSTPDGNNVARVGQAVAELSRAMKG